MIRITGGKDKGRKIKSPPGRKVRPILASIRKVLFDTLGERVPGSVFLDVFAGVGTVGIEALSRGAERVVFVEKDPRIAAIIRENLEMLGYTERAKILVADAFKVFKKLSEEFNIIYLGPPYDIRKIETLPELYLPLLSPDGVLVIQHHHKTKFDFPENFKVKEKKIGENQLTFFEREEEWKR